MATALLGVLLACQQPPDIVWIGDHVAFASDARVCAGTLENLDARAGALLDRFGSGSRTIDYYYIPDRLDDFCSEGAAGCTEDKDVYASHVPLQHELVHAARSSRLPPVFEEGLATYWGDPWPINATAPRDVLPTLFRTQAIDTVQEYARAAHFISFLDDLGGPIALLELDRRLDDDSSAAEIDAALLAIFGADLDSLLLTYEDYPECRGIVDVSDYCEGDTPVLPQESLEVSVQFGCDLDNTLGPYYGTMFIDGVVEFGPTVSGTRVISVTGEAAGEGGRVLLRSCTPCAEPGYEDAVLWFDNSSAIVLPEPMLPAGRYLIRYMAPVEAGPTTLGLYVG